MAIHGNKSQTARTKALADFKRGELQVLVATDIAARGIDIDQLPHVVNFELPNVPEDYVHRIGRTGRAGATGEAISLVCVDEDIFLRDIERLIKRRSRARSCPASSPTRDEKRRADRARPHDHRRRRHAPQQWRRWWRRPWCQPARRLGGGGDRAWRGGSASSGRGSPAAPRRDNGGASRPAAAAAGGRGRSGR